MRSRMLQLGLLAVLIGGWMARSSIAGTATKAPVSSPAMSQRSTGDNQMCKMGGLEDADSRPVALASCFVLNGSFCSTVGSRLRCSITPAEPGLCICQANHTYSCQ
jgi:hypothetical protein